MFSRATKNSGAAPSRSNSGCATAKLQSTARWSPEVARVPSGKRPDKRAKRPDYRHRAWRSQLISPVGHSGSRASPCASARSARHPQLVPRHRRDGPGRLLADRLRPGSTPARGCSTWAAAWAATARSLAERGFDVVALDVVPEYVERARSLGVAGRGLRRQAPCRWPTTRWTPCSSSRSSSTWRTPPSCCARLAAWRAATSCSSTPNCTQSFGGRADRVQPHARRRPSPVLHRGLAERPARRGLQRARRRAGSPARREDRRAGAAAAAAGAQSLARPQRVACAPATSFACAPAARPSDPRPLHLRRARGRGDGRTGDPRARAGQGGGRPLRGDGGGARPELLREMHRWR